jgi:hypothetical protein
MMTNDNEQQSVVYLRNLGVTPRTVFLSPPWQEKAAQQPPTSHQMPQVCVLHYHTKNGHEVAHTLI